MENIRKNISETLDFIAKDSILSDTLASKLEFRVLSESLKNGVWDEIALSKNIKHCTTLLNAVGEVVYRSVHFIETEHIQNTKKRLKSFFDEKRLVEPGDILKVTHIYQSNLTKNCLTFTKIDKENKTISVPQHILDTIKKLLIHDFKIFYETEIKRNIEEIVREERIKTMEKLVVINSEVTSFINYTDYSIYNVYIPDAVDTVEKKGNFSFRRDYSSSVKSANVLDITKKTASKVFRAPFALFATFGMLSFILLPGGAMSKLRKLIPHDQPILVLLIVFSLLFLVFFLVLHNMKKEESAYEDDLLEKWNKFQEGIHDEILANLRNFNTGLRGTMLNDFIVEAETKWAAKLKNDYILTISADVKDKYNQKVQVFKENLK